MPKVWKEWLVESIAKSEMENSWKEFLLSSREVIIFGAGRQARIVIDFCNMFGKKYFCLMTTNSRERWGLIPVEEELPLYLLEEFPGDLDKNNFDIIVAVGTRHKEELLTVIEDYGFQHVYMVTDWVKTNELTRDSYYKAYLEYKGSQFLTDKNGDCYTECHTKYGTFKIYISSDNIFRSNTLGEFNDIVLPSIFDDYSILDSLGPYEYGEHIRLHQGDIVFDLGASVGLFSCVAATKGCQVYAFEPAPYVVNDYLSKNASLYKNITVVPVAISDKNERIKFYINDNLQLNTDVCRNSMIKEKEQLFHEIEVDSLTIDRYIEQNHIERLDFIKAYIEDAEPLMLDGAVKTLQKLKPTLAIFVSPANAESIMRRIKEINPDYKVEQLWRRVFAYV